MPTTLHILNASGCLSKHNKKIKAAFVSTSQRAERLLAINDVDVVIRHKPEYTIKDLGVGGYTDVTGRVVYISLNGAQNINKINIEMCMHHEFFHARRFMQLGEPITLKDYLIDEGLACLYEYESVGKVPIYAKQSVDKKIINLLLRELDDKKLSEEWFFGSEDIPRWVGYTYGFQIVKRYSETHHKKTHELVTTIPSKLYSVFD